MKNVSRGIYNALKIEQAELRSRLDLVSTIFTDDLYIALLPSG